MIAARSPWLRIDGVQTGAELAQIFEEALQHAEAATAELRELAHGFLPSVLTSGGLRAGVDALAARMPVPGIRVRDDGVGGARPDGSGLLGLRDRVSVLGGSLQVEMPPGGGTLVTAAIPVAGDGPSVSPNGKL